MPKFLLCSVPICEIENRYYTVAYLAGIVATTSWEFDYLDLNNATYIDKNTSRATRAKWASSNQLEVFNETKNTIDRIVNSTLLTKIIKWNPDLIGFTLMDSNRHFVIHILRKINELQIKTPIIFGGPDCFPREYHLKYMAERCPPDIMLQGEAEIALPSFLNEFQETGSVQVRLPGFVYKLEDGTMINTGSPPLPFLKRDPIHADYSIFNYTDIHLVGDNTIHTFSSKGCINKCVFCSESRNYQPYRRRPPQEVIKEVEKNLKCIPVNLREKAVVVFRDSIFNASINYIREICNLIMQKRLHISWFCLGAFRVEMHEELLQTMKTSGCVKIFFGFESASQRVIDLMGKNFDITHAQQVIERCVVNKIEVLLPIINGFPGEFTRDFITSMAFILRYQGLDHVTFTYSNICSIKNKTPLSEYPDDFFIEDVDEIQYRLRDHLNTPNTRNLRHLINLSVIQGNDLISCKNLSKLDFNDLPVAAELAQIIFFICQFLDKRKEANEFFYSEKAEELTASSYLKIPDELFFIENLLPGIPLHKWYSINKNEKEQKNRILIFLQKIISEFKHTIRKIDHIDFKKFRNSLYGSLNGDILPVSPNAFQINLLRLSRYDRGRHLIIEGSIHQTKEGPPISQIEINCEDYVFDAHHSISNYFPSFPGQTKAQINFAIKINRHLLDKKNPICKVRYFDNSEAHFNIPQELLKLQTSTISRKKLKSCSLINYLQKTFTK